MEVACYRIQLKPNMVIRVREWSARLNHEMSEVKILLKNEGMSLESVFLEESPQGDFLVYYVRSKDLKRAQDIAQVSQHPIDVFHRQVMKEIAADFRTLECLLDASGDGDF